MPPKTDSSGCLSIHLNGQSSEVLQQAELPEIKATITEYHSQKYQRKIISDISWYYCPDKATVFL